MSIDKNLRRMVRAEIELHIKPLLKKLNAGLSSATGAGTRGRPAMGAKKIGKTPLAAKASRRRQPGPGGRVRDSGGAGGPCAIISCKRPSRSKGFCSAHYQKFRNLERAGRLPGSWKEYARPQSINDVVLPRGRAAKGSARAAK